MKNLKLRPAILLATFAIATLASLASAPRVEAAVSLNYGQRGLSLNFGHHYRPYRNYGRYQHYRRGYNRHYRGYRSYTRPRYRHRRHYGYRY